MAHYRALESERPDALFRDPFARALAGQRGEEIAADLKRHSTGTQWSVVIRTWIIDEMIQKLAAEGIDTVINLGAGLDSRPYRLALPPSLRWIEVDYPSVIAHKERILAAEKPGVSLERIALDLSEVAERQKLFRRLGSNSQQALVLTEGVLPYLTEEQVASLAADLRAEPTFRFWMAEYFSPELYRYFKSKRRELRMKNAPFVFFPTNWLGFFQNCGWVPREARYLPEEAWKVGRMMPSPWWARLLGRLMSQEKRARWAKAAAYIVYERKGNNPKDGA